MKPSLPQPGGNRREFLKTSGAAALAANFALPRSASAADNNTIQIGLVGCGGRGSGAANEALSADPNVVLTAMGDAFSSPIQGSMNNLKERHGDRVRVDAANTFVGLDAFQKVIDSGVDVVLLASPPGFRPYHFKAAVAAGKHVFCEKPMATDPAGVRSILASVEESKRKNLAVVAGFCWRYDFARREFFKQIHSGAVGDIRAIYSTYYTGPVKPMPVTPKPDGMSDLEWQVRNWYNFYWLSGDGLVEQAVHSVDKIAWAMRDQPPLKAVAVGGRQIPNPGGNIFDHFEVNYEYPNGVRAFMGCRQIPNCYNQNADYILGSTGVGTIGVRAQPEINGANERYWRYDGPRNNMYQTEHDELFASIRQGKPINDGVRMAHSTLLAIMGRAAAYTGQEITWDQIMNSQEDIVPDTADLNIKHEAAPMPMPGRTKFI